MDPGTYISTWKFEFWVHLKIEISIPGKGLKAWYLMIFFLNNERIYRLSSKTPNPNLKKFQNPNPTFGNPAHRYFTSHFYPIFSFSALVNESLVTVFHAHLRHIDQAVSYLRNPDRRSEVWVMELCLKFFCATSYFYLRST